ncbi:MAG: hypothetical protein HYX79_07020 [Chloroflexi bacterium]|nr:hypothetical protein [Chloroflexota bacterium]
MSTTKQNSLKEDWYVLEPRSNHIGSTRTKHPALTPETAEWIGMHVVLPVVVGALSAVIAERIIKRKEGHAS